MNRITTDQNNKLQQSINSLTDGLHLIRSEYERIMAVVWEANDRILMDKIRGDLE